MLPASGVGTVLLGALSEHEHTRRRAVAEAAQPQRRLFHKIACYRFATQLVGTKQYRLIQGQKGEGVFPCFARSMGLAGTGLDGHS